MHFSRQVGRRHRHEFVDDGPRGASQMVASIDWHADHTGHRRVDRARLRDCRATPVSVRIDMSV